jgi:hypothetical protein
MRQSDQDAAIAGLAKELGGSSVAVRIASALFREGITSVEALIRLARSLGEDDFRERISDIRQFGDKSVMLVVRAMEKRAAFVLQKDFSKEELFPSLPAGLHERFGSFLSANHSRKNYEIALSADDEQEGVTFGDLYALYGLLYGGSNYLINRQSKGENL